MTEYICEKVDIDFKRNGKGVTLRKSVFQAKEEIVRCRDCKHSRVFDMSWKSPRTADRRFCGYGTYLQYEVGDDGFCAWGERRES